MAKELNAIAERLESHAEDLETIKVPYVDVLMGNYNHAIGMLQNWLQKQFMTKFFDAASKSDAMVEITLRHQQITKEKGK